VRYINLRFTYLLTYFYLLKKFTIRSKRITNTGPTRKPSKRRGKRATDFPKCEVAHKFDKIWTYRSSWSRKVIDLGADRKRICNFLLVIVVTQNHD